MKGVQKFCFCQLSMQILWRRRCSRVVDLKLPTVSMMTWERGEGLSKGYWVLVSSSSRFPRSDWRLQVAQSRLCLRLSSGSTFTKRWFF